MYCLSLPCVLCGLCKRPLLAVTPGDVAWMTNPPARGGDDPATDCRCFLRWLVVFALFSLCTFGIRAASRADTGPGAGNNTERAQFALVKVRLIADGFDQGLIADLYMRSEAAFLPETVQKYITYRERELDYSRFLGRSYLRMGRQYLLRHRKVLRSAQRRFGVDPAVITAILIVESNLGQYAGKNRIFNVLSSLAAAGMSDSPTRYGLELAEEDAKRLRRKGEWAYAELKALLTYTITNGIDPFSVTGSFAGAFGIPQFVPSSCLRFGCDGDGDRVVDLANHNDAIMSAARYLKAAGWKNRLSRKNKAKVLMRYNRSTYYVDTVIKLAQKTGHSQGRTGRGRKALTPHRARKSGPRRNT